MKMVMFLSYLFCYSLVFQCTTCVVSMGFCVCYTYRFFLVSDTVERLRSTYYEEFIDVSFVAVWDEVSTSLSEIYYAFSRHDNAFLGPSERIS